MNGLATVVLAIGIVAGVSILGIALWMMRNEGKPSGTAPGAETAGPVMEADPALKSEIASPPIPPAPSAESVAPIPILDPPPQTESPAWLNSLAPKATSKEILRLRRLPNGDLMVEVDGRQYRTRFEIDDEAVSNRVLDALSDLNYFVNSIAPTPTIASLPPIAPPAPTAAPASAPPPANEKPVVLMSAEEAAKMPITVPRMDIMAQLRYLRAQEKKPQIKIKSMMEEIDELLQAAISGAPLSKRGLKVTETAADVLFWIDGMSYDSVEGLPDADARAAVQAVIQEWNRKR
ncbi:MAG: hypothetical protein FJ030_04130 [Chloroflexi bacterium]|nr:hypothetical protein [Chloroflexota bacterium]